MLRGTLPPTERWS